MNLGGGPGRQGGERGFVNFRRTPGAAVIVLEDGCRRAEACALWQSAGLPRGGTAAKAAGCSPEFGTWWQGSVSVVRKRESARETTGCFLQAPSLPICGIPLTSRLCCQRVPSWQGQACWGGRGPERLCAPCKGTIRDASVWSAGGRSSQPCPGGCVFGT